MPIEREHSWIWFLVLLAVATNAALGYVLWPSGDHDPRTLITISTPGGSREDKVYGELISEFEKANPDLKVNRIVLPSRTIYIKLQTLIAGGCAPDIIQIMTMRLPMFLHRHAFRPLDDLMEGDAEFAAIRRDMYPQCLEGYSLEGKVYGLAYAQNPYALYYNKTLFDTYNQSVPPDHPEQRVPYPSGDWDLEQLTDVAKKLTRDLDGDGQPDQFGMITVNRSYMYVINPILHRFGAEVFSPDKKKCLLGQPAAIEALSWYYNLGLKDHCVPSFTGSDARAGGISGGPEEQFIGGKIAMWEAEGEWASTFKDRIRNFQWDIAEPPHGREKAVGYEAFGMSMSATTKHPKEAWRFLKFLVGPEGQKILFKYEVGVPILKSLATSKDYFLKPGSMPPSRDVFLKTIEYGQDIPSLRNFTEVEAAIMAQLDLALIGEKPTADACKAAARDANALLKENEEEE